MQNVRAGRHTQEAFTTVDFLACVGTTTLESIFLKEQRTRQFALVGAPPASRSPVLNLSSEGCPRVHVWRGLCCVRASPRRAWSCWCVPDPSRTDRGLCTSSSPGDPPVPLKPVTPVPVTSFLRLCWLLFLAVALPTPVTEAPRWALGLGSELCSLLPRPCSSQHFKHHQVAPSF